MKVDFIKHYGKIFIDADQLLLFLLESTLSCSSVPDAQQALKCVYEELRDKTARVKEYI